MIGVNLDVTERKKAEEALLGLNRKLGEAQEQERARIARELHDDISQRLAVLAMQLELVKGKQVDLPPEVQLRMEKLRNDTHAICRDVQLLSHELHSSQLELGIVNGMKNCGKEFGEHYKLDIDFNSQDVPSNLPQNISLSLIRVLQEALHNVVKHSRVRQAEVRLWESAGNIQLTVKDSGTGFDVGAAQNGRGLGLTSMGERLRLIHGSLSIDSRPKQGTTIHARVPFSLTTGSEHRTA
jgi:signal transduction histidine kinase